MLALMLNMVKSEQVKKITVSIPLKVLKLLTDARTRRQVNNLRHATNSELLCEAFCMHSPANHYWTTTICVKSETTKSPELAKEMIRKMWIRSRDLGVLTESKPDKAYKDYRAR